jgi:hypothetical protein
LAEAEKLACCYGLNNLNSGQIDSLLKMVGGNPYRIAMAFYYLFSEKLLLEKIIEEAPTTTGIYSSHLRGLLVHLQTIRGYCLAQYSVFLSGEVRYN